MEGKMGREKWPDVMKAAAACAVVLLHTVTGVMDNTDMAAFPVETKVFQALMDLTTWSVPLFLIISGYFFLNLRRQISFSAMITKYCRRVLLALFLFGIPYACLELAAGEGAFRPGMLWEAFLMALQGKSWSHMWYLYLILFLYLLTPLLRRILGLLPQWGADVLLLLLFSGCCLTVFGNKLTGGSALPMLPETGIYLFYYLWGGRMAARVPELKRVEAGIAPLAFTVVLLAAGMAVSRLGGNYTVRMAYNYPFTVALALSLAVLARRLELCGKMISWRKQAELAALSFAVYLLHPLFLNVFYKVLHVTPLSFPLYLSLPFFYGMTLSLSAAGAWLLRRIEIMRRYVL